MNRQSGFTMLELLTAVAVAAVLLVVALPNYQQMIKNNCLTTDANSLVTSLQQARSEAVKRSTTTTLTATNAADSSNEWGLGWKITIDEDRNGNGTLDAGEDYDGDGALSNSALVREVGLTCTKTTVDEPADTTSITYDSSGFPSTSAKFNVCDDRTGETGRQVSISFTGRPSTESNYTGCP
jgi:type IV fimbrial biogenesis protein FimT